MKDLVDSLLREQKPRYVFVDGEWRCVQTDHYQAWRMRVPRVLRTRLLLRVVRGGRS